jgi:SecD/SecF fusion protein
MSRHPAPVVGVALLALGVLAAVWGYERMPAALHSRFGLYLASTEPQEGYRAATVQLRAETIYVAPTAALTSADVAQAQLESSAEGRPQIAIALTAGGRRRLADVTRQNVHKRLAIVVDDRVIIAPTITSEISDGGMLLTGAFTRQECEQIAEAISPGR